MSTFFKVLDTLYTFSYLSSRQVDINIPIIFNEEMKSRKGKWIVPSCIL